MALLCLITTPTKYAKLQAEIDMFVSTSEKPCPSPIPESSAIALPYLNAVIREALRLYPPVLSLASKQVPPGGDIIDGFYIPEGTQIAHNHYGLCRSRKIWGPDAIIFKPERWLLLPGASDEEHAKLKVMEGDLDLIFGYGKYRCMGVSIAMMEIRKAVFEVYIYPFQ